MDIPDFKSFNVTTMTLVSTLSGEINLDPTFIMLPIKEIDLPVKKRQVKKFKIPHFPVDGCILSMRHLGETRGIIKSESKKYFKNCITIDISGEIKNINIKLSKNKMQMCGARSPEMGRDSGNQLLNLIKTVNTNVKKIKENNDLTEKTIDTFSEMICIEKSQREVKVTTNKKVGNINLTINNKIYKEEYIIDNNLTCPVGLDVDLFQFLKQQCEEISYYSDFVNFLSWINTIDKICDDDLHIVDINKEMINYNYGLGFTIDRVKLRDFFSMREGFFARYDNTTEHIVTVEVPYDYVKKKKNKIPKITFLIYTSGLVTQSGASEDIMEKIYYDFMNVIKDIKPFIRTDKPNIPKYSFTIRR